MSDFNKYSIIELPRNVVVGHKVLPGIPKDCKRLGLPKSVFLVVDEVTKDIAGLEVEGYLQDAGFDTDMVTIKEADADTIQSVEELAREFTARFEANHCPDLIHLDLSAPSASEEYQARGLKSQCEEYIRWAASRAVELLSE